MKLAHTRAGLVHISIIKIIQNIYLILLFPIFVLSVNPAGLADILPPGTSYYIYSLWPKLSVLSALFCTALLGAITTFIYDREGVINTLMRYKFIWFFLILFLAMYCASVLYNFESYLTNYEVWQGPIIHGDGILFTLMWWMLIPLSVIAFQNCFVKNYFFQVLVVFSFSVSFMWALLNHFGIEPARIINPTLLDNGTNAGFGNRSWAGFVFSLFFIAFFFKNLRSSLSTGWLLMTGLATTAIILTGGRMGLINISLTVLGSAIYLLHCHLPFRRLLWPSLIIIIFGAVSYQLQLGSSSRLTGLAKFQTDGGFTHRIIPWKAGLREMAKSPLLGNHTQTTGDIIWKNLTTDETKELLTEFAPREAIFNGRYTFSDGSLIVFNDKTKEANVSSVAFSRFHNQYIELGVRGGVQLPIVYISLLICLILTLIRRNETVSYSTALIVFCYAIYNIVWFTGPVVEPFTLAIIGLGLARRSPVSAKYPV